MMPAEVFVVMPAFNEGEMLRSSAEQLLAAGYKVVVVDDGSAIHQQTFLKQLPVFFLRHKINLGQGAALETGNLFSLKRGAKFIVHFDADGQHRVTDISALLSPLLNNECDITFGSRFLNAGQNSVPFIKKLLIWIARYLNLLFTGLLLSDAHNGLRAMNQTAAKQIRVKENRMSHASEILFHVKKFRLRFKEVPVTILYTDYSKQKGQSVWNSIRIVFDLLLHKLFK